MASMVSLYGTTEPIGASSVFSLPAVIVVSTGSQRSTPCSRSRRPHRGLQLPVLRLGLRGGAGQQHPRAKRDGDETNLDVLPGLR